MRKENENFEKIYEGEKNNYTINNLISNTEYEFRICSFYNNSFGPFSKIQKVKTFNIDSIILKESKREDVFLKKYQNGLDLRKWFYYIEGQEMK